MMNQPRTVLCYGDSNTWGWNPETFTRYPLEVRWPGVLARSLGEGYRVIEEGLSGRTTVWDDPIEGRYLNGKTYLIPCLASHKPLDLVILMLGTNDLKARFGLTALDIALGVGALVDVIKASGAGPDQSAPGVMIVAPPPVGLVLDEVGQEMFAGAAEKSRLFGTYYQRIAAEKGCLFLDAGVFIESSSVDGVHLSEAAHRTLGEAIAQAVKAAE